MTSMARAERVLQTGPGFLGGQSTQYFELSKGSDGQPVQFPPTGGCILHHLQFLCCFLQKLILDFFPEVTLHPSQKKFHAGIIHIGYEQLL